jgi:glycosyltransferase involved in cell wall biosynthesis
MPDWQLVVVDDGSTDETAAYIEGLREPRIMLRHVAHCGNPAILRNLGATSADARYLAFIDSDDLWAPTKLERQLEGLAGGACRWSYTLASVVDAQGRPVPDERWFAEADPASGDVLEPILRGRVRIALPSVVIDTRLFSELRGFDESYEWCEDLDLWLRFAAASAVHAVPERLTHVRRHPGNLTHERIEPYRFAVRAVDACAASHADASIRRLCRHRRAFLLTRSGDEWARRGLYREACRDWLTAFRARPFHGHLLATVSRWMLRTALPRTLRAALLGPERTVE